ncbi:VOC family protein [Paenibacillus thailandensis]|uniref:VOC family protein n=1 Tax=Paenibacillus thailandensis TaxID=393250 RepID=A0ABW5QV56_9BACL
MPVEVYFNFNGNCREAIEFYAETFGVDKPQIMTFGEGPQSPEFTLPEEAKNLVMHARLSIWGSNVMFSDVFPGMPFQTGNNITLALLTDNAEDVRAAFDKLKEGGTVAMELQETFWSKLYGQVTDKFGVQWQLNLNSEPM